MKVTATKPDMPVDLSVLKVQAIASLGEFIVKEHSSVLPLFFEKCKTDEEIGTALFYVFEKSGRTKALIHDSMQEIRKLQRTELALTEYLRGNEISMTIASKYLHALGHRYLNKVIFPTLKKVLAKFSSYEINLEKTSTENLWKNLGSLLKGTTKILDAVFKHTNEIPMDLKELLFNLYSEVNAIAPTTKEKVVGSTFFLRLLCPAITKAKIEDKNVDANMRRGLILMAKLIQLIANCTNELSENDPMKLCENYIKEQIPKYCKFSNAILDIKTKTNAKTSDSSSHKYYEASVNHIYTWLFKNYEICDQWILQKCGSVVRDNFQAVMDEMRKVTGTDPTFADDFQNVWKRVQSRINLHELGLAQRGDSRLTFSDSAMDEKTGSYDTTSSSSVSEIDECESDSSSSFPVSNSFSDKPIMLKIFHEKNKKMQIMKLVMPSFASTMEWIQKQFDLNDGQAFRLYTKKDGQKIFVTDDTSFTSILPDSLGSSESLVQTLFIESI